MSSRRDAVVITAAVALGLVLGFLAVTQRSEVEHLRQWLRGVPPRGAAPGALSTLQNDVAAARAVLEELAVERARLHQHAGRDQEALEGLRQQIQRHDFTPTSLVGIEEVAIRLRTERDSVARERSERPPGSGQPTAGDWTLHDLLTHTPPGLGDAGTPGHERASAFVSAVLLATTQSATANDHEVARALAEVVDGDADRLVGVLSAWAELSDVLPEDSPARRNGRISRDALVELCQALLDAGQVDDAMCDALAAHARVRGTERSRALAAMALAELADLPIGLGWGLPTSAADGRDAPRRFIADAWTRVRELAGEEAFAARVAWGLEEYEARRTEALPREHPPGVTSYHGGAHVWLMAHVAPSSPRSGDWSIAQRVASRELSPVAALRTLAGGATDPASILAIMEDQRDLRLPLHHLLTLTGAAGDRQPPRWAASSHSRGIVMAWRETLGLANAAWTVRVARVERGLDGLTILAEEQRFIRAGEPVEVSWSETTPDDMGADPSWTTPGSLAPATPVARIEESVALELSWADDGATLTAPDVTFRIRHANGGGASSTSGSSWPAEIPVALTPWGDSHDASSRRAFLIAANSGDTNRADWTLNEWREAASAAFTRVADRVRPPPRTLGRDRDRLWMLGDTLALLRPEIDADRLQSLRKRERGLGPGVERALAFAGKRVLVQDTPGGLPTPSKTARSLPARDIAELALHAKSEEVRAAMMWLLTSEKPPPPPLAHDLLDLERSAPGRLTADVVVAAKDGVESSRVWSGERLYGGIAGFLWCVTLFLLMFAFLRCRFAHGARGAATLLLGAALVLAQATIVAAGVIITPAWAGWGLAAFAVWIIGRRRAERAAWTCILAFGVAAIVGAGAHVAGLPAEIVAAVAAVAGCLLLAPLGPALIAGLVIPDTGKLPRKPSKGTGWALYVRAGLGALFAAAIIGAGLAEGPRRAVTVGLFYLPFAFCFGGIVLWRLALARDGAVRRFPAPFVFGLVTPGVILLITETATRVTVGESRELLDPLGPMLRVSISCALLFALIRLLDAARIRGRADASGGA